MKSNYAVFVKPGLTDDCSDTEGVYFGNRHGGQYFRHDYAVPGLPSSVDIGCRGAVVVAGYKTALALRNALSTGGDWDEGETPEYALVKLDAR